RFGQPLRRPALIHAARAVDHFEALLLVNSRRGRDADGLDAHFAKEAALRVPRTDEGNDRHAVPLVLDRAADGRGGRAVQRGGGRRVVVGGDLRDIDRRVADDGLDLLLELVLLVAGKDAAPDGGRAVGGEEV